MHGDFAPWNLREQDGEISAFDWEYGVVDGLPGLDALHHVWQTCMLLEKSGASEALAALEACARSLGLGMNKTEAAAFVNLYLAHGLAQRLELGCEADDGLLQGYRAALALRPVARKAAV
jgi:hypothetical protein